MNNITNTTTTKGVENMVKKAETLKSLAELNLSKRTCAYLERGYGSTNEIIKEGRIIAFGYQKYPEMFNTAPKWKLELITALEKAGFIRPVTDFAQSLNINSLYGALHGYYDRGFITSIDQLTNEQYENFKGYDKVKIEAIKSALQSQLTKMELEIISYRFGLEDGCNASLDDCKEHFGVTRERIRYCEAKALRKLRASRHPLPPILESSTEDKKQVDSIIEEIEELHKSPVYQKEAELRQRLRIISMMPFEHAKKAKEYLDGGASDFTDIERFNFSRRTYNCLKRAGINTIADIIRQDDWSKVRNLNRQNLAEIVEIIHSIGYTNFNINLLS